jgi:UbiD family decarboxylase
MAGPFPEAVLYDIGNRMNSGLVTDVNVLDSLHGSAGLVIQVKKRTKMHDEFPRSIIMSALSASSLFRLIIVVDEDINIYSADDVMWALATRVDPKKDIIAFGADGIAPLPPGRGKDGKMGFDATYPFDGKFTFERRKYPKVNLEKWFTRGEIEHAQANQSDYAKFLAESRY